jgi:hypothetical protein
VGISCAHHATPLYPQQLVLISPTSGGRSVGTVTLRTKATEISFMAMFFFIKPDYRLIRMAAPSSINPDW